MFHIDVWSPPQKGIWGAIAGDRFDRTSVGFAPTLSEARIFDFSVVFHFVHAYYVMDIEKASQLDWTLYTRPLTIAAW